MEISTFELLYRPLTPPLGDGTEAIARRVLQGYFLTVSNLDDERGFTFTITFRISLPDPPNPSRTLAGNALFISDVAGPGNQFRTFLLNQPRGSNRFSANFAVPAGATALVVLLPNITVPGFFSSGPADIEIRGNVQLDLPCRLPEDAPFGRLVRTEPQPGAPAPVLLNAEHRATYLPRGWPEDGVRPLDFDQTGTAVALASGRARNDVASPDPCPLRIRRPETGDPGSPFADGPEIDIGDGLEGIVREMERLDADRANLDAMSAVLRSAGVNIRLVPGDER